MRKKYLLLLMFLTSSAFAACPPTEQLQQAFFSLTPQTSGVISQLHAADLDNHQKLFFFSRVVGNASGALLHRWQHNQRPLATLRLQTGNGNWQSWSAQALTPDSSGTWTVEVLDDHLCLLGKASISLAATDAVLTQVRALLASQDVTGAKLALKAALAKPDASRADKRRWLAFMQRELVLAEVAADIRQQQLVAAQGRLEALNGKLEGQLEVQHHKLQQQLQTAKKTADRNRLFTLIAAIHSLAISSRCPADRQGAQQMLAPLLPHGDSGISGFKRDDNRISLSVMLPSGASKQLNWPCQPLLSLP